MSREDRENWSPLKRYVHRRVIPLIWGVPLAIVVGLVARGCGFIPQQATPSYTYVPYESMLADQREYFERALENANPVIDDADGWVYEAKTLSQVSEEGMASRSFTQFDLPYVVRAKLSVRPGPKVRPGDAAPAYLWALVEPDGVVFGWPDRCDGGIRRPSGVAGMPNTAVEPQVGTKVVCWNIKSNPTGSVMLVLIDPGLDYFGTRDYSTLSPHSIRVLREIRLPPDPPSSVSPTPRPTPAGTQPSPAPSGVVTSTGPSQSK